MKKLTHRNDRKFWILPSISVSMRVLISIQILSASAVLSALSAQPEASGAVSVSGSFESTVSANLGADEDAGRDKRVSYGVEEYANVRAQARVGDAAMFFGAVNFIAAAGDYAVKAAALGAALDSGENYAARIEIERLYFRLKGEDLTLDGGLLRLPFGHGRVWRSSDFLNPKNPLRPNARPRAVLGSGLSWYPADDFKALFFAATGGDPFSRGSGIAGVSADFHYSAASAQPLYSIERSNRFPATNQSPWTHRAGLSVKADIEVGLVMDMLYAYNEAIEDKADGLSLSVGFDYSLFDARLVALAEYLYNGAASSTSIRSGGGFANRNYLYAGLTWRVSDLTNVGLAAVAGIDDASAVPLVTASSEIFQGVTISLTAQIPTDKDLLLKDGNRGELGPIAPAMTAGSYFYVEGGVKVKF